MTITISRRTAALAVASSVTLAVLFGVSACSQKQQEKFQDAPTSARDKTAVEIYDDADGFSNWSEKCDRHGNRVFVAFHNGGAYAAITAIKDPTCPTS